MTPRRWLAAIVAAHLLIGLLYVWATPMFEASDEGVHYGVIQWLVRGRGLPVQDPAVRDAIYGQEGSQPPLYYLLSAGLTVWLPTGDFEQVFVMNPLSEVGYVGAAHNVNLYRPAPPEASGETARAVVVIRLFSLALSCGTVALAYALARRAGGGETVALLAAAAVAFNPMALFINAAINNDNLLMLLSTAALVLMLDLARARTAPAYLALAGLGVVLGLAALTKVSGLVVWPVAALALAWGEWTRTKPEDRLRRLWPLALQLGLTFTVAAVVCGWWFARNWLLYHEPLGLDTMVAIAGPRSVDVWTLVTQEWYGFYLSFWGIFGAFTLLPGVWAQWVFHALTVMGLAGGALAAWRARQRLTFAQLLLAGFSLLTLIGVIRWTMTTPASQGRLLFGALAPLSLGLAAGWLALVPQRWQRWAALALGGLLAGVAAVIPVADIAPQYARPAALGEAALPADLRSVRVRFGASLELVGYTANDAPQAPGHPVAVTLYWRALAPMAKDYAFALVVFGRGTEAVGQIDTWPGAGRLPTSQMQPGALYADPYALPVSVDATTPTRLRLRVTGWDEDPANPLPVFGPDGAALTAVTFPVGSAVAAAPPEPTPAVPDGATFEYDLTLLGYDAVVAGSQLQLTFYWRAGQALPTDYTLFLHFLDDAGTQVHQADGPPVDGDWPTSAWLPGQVVVDRRVIVLPADLPAACCALRLGWYDPASGARLLAFRPGGAPWDDNAVILPDAFRP